MEKAQNIISGIVLLGVLVVVYGIIISFASVNIVPGVIYYIIGGALIIIGTILHKSFEGIKDEFYSIYKRLEVIEQNLRSEDMNQ